MTKSSWVAGALTFATASAAIAAPGAQFYVDPTSGSDSNNNCEASSTPCATINHAALETEVQTPSPVLGDATINLAAGTYSESVAIGGRRIISGGAADALNSANFQDPYHGAAINMVAESGTATIKPSGLSCTAGGAKGDGVLVSNGGTVHIGGGSGSLVIETLCPTRSGIFVENGAYLGFLDSGVTLSSEGSGSPLHVEAFGVVEEPGSATFKITASTDGNSYTEAISLGQGGYLELEGNPAVSCGAMQISGEFVREQSASILSTIYPIASSNAVCNGTWYTYYLTGNAVFENQGGSSLVGEIGTIQGKAANGGVCDNSPGSGGKC